MVASAGARRRCPQDRARGTVTFYRKRPRRGFAWRASVRAGEADIPMPVNIGAWLRGLELEQYAQAFHDNAIDDDILSKLTADDLKDLGVSLVGHRRKLLEAIAALQQSPLLS